MVSLIYSYDTGRVIRASTIEIRFALKIVTGITMVLSLVGAFKALYNQLKGMYPFTLIEYSTNNNSYPNKGEP